LELHPPTDCSEEAKQNLENRRGAGADINFELTDFEVVELAIGLIPEVRICALALKWARAARLQYPIETGEQIVKGFPHTKFSGGGDEIPPTAFECSWPMNTFLFVTRGSS